MGYSLGLQLTKRNWDFPVKLHVTLVTVLTFLSISMVLYLRKAPQPFGLETAGGFLEVLPVLFAFSLPYLLLWVPLSFLVDWQVCRVVRFKSGG